MRKDGHPILNIEKVMDLNILEFMAAARLAHCGNGGLEETCMDMYGNMRIE